MMNRNELKFYAEYFHDLGVNISFVSNQSSKYNFLFDCKRLKAPFYEWKIYEAERQSAEILNSYDWENCFGIGVILGFNRIAAIDIDGCVNEEIIRFILDTLKLPKNYEWVTKSGSQAGYHILFKTNKPDHALKRTHKAELGYYQPLDDSFGKVAVNAYYPLDNIPDDIAKKWNENSSSQKLINNNSFEKIEFKWEGHVVVPPSSHSCGRQYLFVNQVPRTEPLEIPFELLSELQIMISGKFAQDSSKQGKNAIYDEEDIITEDNCALIIDCETNGLPIDFRKDFTYLDNWPRVLQVSWIVCGRNVPVLWGNFPQFYVETLNLIKRETKNILPKDFVVDSKAELIHSLSTDFLKNVGEDLKGVLQKFIKDVQKCSLIIGHNLEFDLNVIKSEMLRCGIDYNFTDGKKLFCTMENSTELCKIGSIPHKYPSLNELFLSCFEKKILIDHNSIFDAFLTMKCFNEMGKIEANRKFQVHLNANTKKENNSM